MKDEEETKADLATIEKEQVAIEQPTQNAFRLSSDVELESDKVAPIVETPQPKVEEAEVKVETPEAKVEVKQPLELDEETAFNFLKEKRGLEVNSLDEFLTPKEQKKYAPELEKFQEFIEKTGNTNFNDFQETQKDWSTESEEVRLKSFIKLSNPTLTEKEVTHLYNKKYDVSELDEDDDESEILEKGINIKTDLKQADEFFAKRQEEFKAVSGTDEHIPNEYREAKKFVENQKQEQEKYDLLVQEINNDTIEKANKVFGTDFEGFKFKVTNEEKGIDEVVFKPENVQEAKNWHTKPSNLNKLFFDENGKLKNPDEFFALAEIGRIGVKNFVQQIRNTSTALVIEKQDKISKNIQPDNVIVDRNPVTASTWNVSQ